MPDIQYGNHDGHVVFPTKDVSGLQLTDHNITNSRFNCHSLILANSNLHLVGPPLSLPVLPWILCDSAVKNTVSLCQ